jgi:hypothetical protein
MRKILRQVSLTGMKAGKVWGVPWLASLLSTDFVSRP